MDWITTIYVYILGDNKEISNHLLARVDPTLKSCND